jgi:diamine N-acetyltransferase
MDVELREITSETVRDICALEVADGQRTFVAPNAVSIAEAHFAPHHWMRAIYADGEPAGFLLADEESDPYLWRFMVAAGFQGRGIGRRALELLLERWRGLGARRVTLSVEPENRAAAALYESFGFAFTGEVHAGERVMRLEL